MASNVAFATKLPPDVVEELNAICERYGLRKNFVVEQALREKLEDLVDAFDLEEARKDAVSFTAWDQFEDELKAKGKL